MLSFKDREDGRTGFSWIEADGSIRRWAISRDPDAGRHALFQISSSPVDVPPEPAHPIDLSNPATAKRIQADAKKRLKAYQEMGHAIDTRADDDHWGRSRAFMKWCPDGIWIGHAKTAEDAIIAANTFEQSTGWLPRGDKFRMSNLLRATGFDRLSPGRFRRRSQAGDFVVSIGRSRCLLELVRKGRKPSMILDLRMTEPSRSRPEGRDPSPWPAAIRFPYRAAVDAMIEVANRRKAAP